MEREVSLEEHCEEEHDAWMTTRAAGPAVLSVCALLRCSKTTKLS